MSHLQPLLKPFNATIWQDDYIRPGDEWRLQIKSKLEQTDVFILLVSVDFMNSPFINQTEFEYAVQKHRTKKAIIVPVIIRDCLWDLDIYLKDDKFNLSQLQVLPTDGKPIEEWSSPEAAYKDVALGIRTVLQSLTKGSPYENPKTLLASNQNNYKSNTRERSKVQEPPNIPKLSRNSLVAFILAFITASCVVIWGPSIVGSDKAIIYLLILVPLAFAPAVMLFKTLRSYSSSNGTGMSSKMEFIGPIVVFVLVIASGFIFYQNPPFSVQDLSIMIYDKNGSSLLTGKAIVKYKNRAEEISVNNSRGMFPDVKMGEPLSIKTNFLDYRNVEFDTTVTKLGTELVLYIEKDTAYLNKVMSLKRQLISVIDTYIISANDIVKCLDVNIKRILSFDDQDYDTAMNEVIKFSKNYEKAYLRLIAASDSLILELNYQTKTDHTDLERVNKEAKQFHAAHIRKYNDSYYDKINGYIFDYKATGRQNVEKRKELIGNIHDWADLAKPEIRAIEIEFATIKNNLKL